MFFVLLKNKKREDKEEKYAYNQSISKARQNTTN